MEKIILVERMLIESLSRKEKNSYELSEDTGLGPLVVTNILASFLKKEYIYFSSGRFFLKKDFFDKRITQLNSYNAKVFELKSLFLSILNFFFKNEKNQTQKQKGHLKLKKIWLTSEEQKILNSQLKSLELFFESIEQKRKTKSTQSKLAEKKIVFWGCCAYKDLALSSLQNL